MTVVMGDIALDICPFCNSEMQPIEQVLLNRMHEEVAKEW